MDWVKRNLAFVIGTGLAVVLMLLSGFYLYSNSAKNNEAREQLEAEYNELKRLHQLKPHPGKGDVDNISLARQQKDELLQVIARVEEQLEPITAIPANTNVTGEQFSASLRRTIDQLNRGAKSSSVIVPTNYNFSFEAEKRLVKFAPGSLDRLAVQLGEVKALSEILFAAKVNKLTGLRRPRVSPDDWTGPQSDYFGEPSETNELAVISPYEISFESFSAELSAVVSGFANSPHGIVIEGLNVRPAKALAARGSRYGMGATAQPGAQPIYAAPVDSPYGAEVGGGYDRYGGGAAGIGEGGGYDRYGGGGGGYGGGGGQTQIRRPTFNRPALGGRQASPYEAAPTPQPQRMYAQPGARSTVGTGAAAGSQTLIDEHPLTVTMIVKVIKPLPPQEY